MLDGFYERRRVAVFGQKLGRDERAMVQLNHGLPLEG